MGATEGAIVAGDRDGMSVIGEEEGFRQGEELGDDSEGELEGSAVLGEVLGRE